MLDDAVTVNTQALAYLESEGDRSEKKERKKERKKSSSVDQLTNHDLIVGQTSIHIDLAKVSKPITFVLATFYYRMFK